MGLLNDLRDIADKIDSSLLPTSQELPGLVGALVYRVEHGAEFVSDLAEKEAQDVSEWIADRESGPAPKQPARQDPTTAWPPSTVNVEDAPSGDVSVSTPTTTPAVDAPQGAPIVTPPAPATIDTPQGPAGPDTSSDSVETDRELRAQISDLRAQLTARKATDGKTTVTHDTGSKVIPTSEVV
jgi:hypothetical protein